MLFPRIGPMRRRGRRRMLEADGEAIVALAVDGSIGLGGVAKRWAPLSARTLFGARRAWSPALLVAALTDTAGWEIHISAP